MSLFPNCCVALRIYCTLPITVAQAERSFSILKRINSVDNVPNAIDIIGNFGCGVRVGETAAVIESFANKKHARLLLALPSSYECQSLCMFFVILVWFALHNTNRKSRNALNI